MASRLVARQKTHEIDEQNGPKDQTVHGKNEEIHTQAKASGNRAEPSFFKS
jgi:hypothetical protein